MNPKSDTHWYEEKACWQTDCQYSPKEKKIIIELWDGRVAFACLKHFKDPDEG